MAKIGSITDKAKEQAKKRKPGSTIDSLLGGKKQGSGLLGGKKQSSGNKKQGSGLLSGGTQTQPNDAYQAAIAKLMGGINNGITTGLNQIPKPNIQTPQPMGYTQPQGMKQPGGMPNYAEMLANRSLGGGQVQGIQLPGTQNLQGIVPAAQTGGSADYVRRVLGMSSNINRPQQPANRMKTVQAQGITAPSMQNISNNYAGNVAGNGKQPEEVKPVAPVAGAPAGNTAPMYDGPRPEELLKQQNAAEINSAMQDYIRRYGQNINANNDQRIAPLETNRNESRLNAAALNPMDVSIRNRFEQKEANGLGVPKGMLPAVRQGYGEQMRAAQEWDEKIRNTSILDYRNYFDIMGEGVRMGAFDGDENSDTNALKSDDKLREEIEILSQQLLTTADEDEQADIKNEIALKRNLLGFRNMLKDPSQIRQFDVDALPNRSPVISKYDSNYMQVHGDPVDVAYYYANVPYDIIYQEAKGVGYKILQDDDGNLYTNNPRPDKIPENLHPSDKRASKYMFMTKDERDIFNTLYLNGERGKADYYLSLISSSLEERKAAYNDNAARWMVNNGVLGKLEGLGTVFTNPVASLLGSIQALGAELGIEGSGDKYSPLMSGLKHNESIRDEVGKNWDAWTEKHGFKGLGRFLSGVSFSIADNVLALLIGKAAGSLTAETSAQALRNSTTFVQIVMSTEATGNKFIQQLNAGVDPTLAATRAFASGVVEAITEKYSIEHYLNASNKDKFLQYMVKSFVAEGSEEVASDWLYAVSDEILSRFLNQQSEMAVQYEQLKAEYGEDEAFRMLFSDFLNQNIESFLAGGISGLGMGGAGYAMNTIGTGRTVIRQENSAQNIDAMLRAVETQDAGTEAKKLASDIRKNMENNRQPNMAKLGRLTQLLMENSNEEIRNTYESAYTEVINDELANRGLNEKQISKIGPIVTKALLQDISSLTRSERNALHQNDTAASLMLELTEGIAQENKTIRQAEELAQERSKGARQINMAAEKALTGTVNMTDNIVQEAKKKAQRIAEEAVESTATGPRTGSNVEVQVDDGYADIVDFVAVEEKTKDKNGKEITTKVPKIRVMVDGKPVVKNLAEVKATNTEVGAVIQMVRNNPRIMGDAYLSEVIRNAQKLGTDNMNGRYAEDVMAINIAAKLGKRMPWVSIGSEMANNLYGMARAEMNDHDRAMEEEFKGKVQRTESGKGKLGFDGTVYGTKEFNQKIDELHLKPQQKHEVSILGAFAKKAGLNNIELIYDPENTDDFGYFEHKTGKVMINIAGMDSKKNGVAHSMLITAGHEFTHMLQALSAKAYSNARKTVLDMFEDKGANIENMVNEKINSYYKHGVMLSVEDAIDEIVADSYDQVLLSEEFANSLKETDIEAYGKVRKFVARLIGTLKRIVNIARGSASTESWSLYLNGKLEKMAKVWLDEFENAMPAQTERDAFKPAEQYTAEQVEDARDIVQEAATHPVTQFSVNTNNRGVQVQVIKNGLMAVHNLSERSFVSVLEMLGFPMPSIAVIGSQAWTGYGNISVFFGENAVRFAEGSVYNGDAMTPTLGNNRVRNTNEAMDVLHQQPARGSRGTSDMVQLFTDYKEAANIDEARRKAYQTTEERQQIKEQADALQSEIFDAAKRISTEKYGSDLNNRQLTQSVGMGVLTAAEIMQREQNLTHEDRMQILQDNMDLMLEHAQGVDLTAEDFTTEQYEQMLEFIDVASQLSSGWRMMESKPDTVLDFKNDLKAVLMPDDTPNKIIQQALDAGIAKEKILFYPHNNMKARQAAMMELPNVAEGVRFSMRTADNENVVRTDREAINRDLMDSLENGETQYGGYRRFSKRVTDPVKLEMLEKQEKNKEVIETYKTMQLFDGKLYPPMAALIKGKLEDAAEIGQWQEATEHPELIKFDENGKAKFDLKKGGGKGSVDNVAYNPYEHSSNLMINDQFKGAYDRPNLVTVKCIVPKSEGNGAYQAQYAKDATGWHDWHSGDVATQLRNTKGTDRKVFLSRWLKPIRVVPDSEVAQHYKELLEGTDIQVPDNVVSPNLLEELKKAGVPILETEELKEAVRKKEQKRIEKNKKKYEKTLKRDKAYFDNILKRHPNITILQVANPINVSLDSKGNIITRDVVSEARKNDNVKEFNDGKTQRNYAFVPDLGIDVQIDRDGIEHNFVRGNTKDHVENAIIAQYAGDLLQYAVEVNRGEAHPDKNAYEHVMVSGIKLGTGQNAQAFAVRMVIENRFDQDAKLVKAGIIGRLNSIKEKKSNINGFPSENAQSPDLGTSEIRLSDFFEDVKNDLNDTFADEVYRKRGIQRAKTDFSEHLRYSLKTSAQDVGLKVTDSGEIQDNRGNTIAMELEGGSVARYSLNSWRKENQIKIREMLMKTGQFTGGQVDKWINNVNSIAAIIAEDTERLDYIADKRFRFRKPNSDFYKYTLDASTLCKKRLEYQGTLNAIQKALPNTPLRPGDLIDLANMMREMGHVTPCGICYVESKRRHAGNFSQEFIDNYKKNNPNGYIPTLADLVSTEGLYKLREEHPEVYKAYISANNRRGSGSVKPVQNRTDYRKDMRYIKKETVEYLNKIGGLRMQSFSDFETPHLIDITQALLDMSAKGLKSQAYTKVPDFAWVFGNTGIKINLSLMGEGNGLDANGNLIFSSVEGMDFDEAMKLRDAYSDNVGTILVGMNNAHIIAAMGDSRIDFIIPFHQSGWSREELNKMDSLKGYEDFTETQNERNISDGKKAETGILIDDYWDYDRTGTENAEAYLELCAKQGLIPKFDQFLVNNGDGTYSLPTDNSKDSENIRKGYWKLLIDYKMYNNEGEGVEQQAVTPDINMEEAMRVLGEYEGGANTLPVAQDVVDRFVEHMKNKPEEENGEDYDSMPKQKARYANEENVRRSLRNTAQIDQEYEDAYNNYDDEAAEEIIHEMAERSMPNSKIRDKDGKLKIVYHQTNADPFTVFDMNKARQTEDVVGAFFAPEYDKYHEYGDRTYAVYLNITNPAYDVYDMDLSQEDAGLKKRNELIAQGYDGVINTEDGEEIEYIAFYPEQIKSADPFVEDDDGNLIYPSQRFNEWNPDIRYSRRTPDMDVNNWMESLQPWQLRTESERQLLQDYKDLRMKIQLQNRKISDYQDRLKALEAKDKATLTEQEKRLMDGLKVRIQNAQNTRDELEEKLINVTSDEGYAKIMMQQSQFVDDFLAGRTQDEVAEAINRMQDTAEQVQTRIRKTAEELKKIAENEGVQRIRSMMNKNHLDKVAADIRKQYHADIDKQELMNAIAKIRLEVDNGEADAANEDIMALAGQIMDSMRSEPDEALKRLRGITLTLSPGQLKELTGSNRSLTELRRELAGTGIKVKTATMEEIKSGRKTALSNSWDELCDMLDGKINRDTPAEQQIFELMDFIRGAMQARGQAGFSATLGDTISDLWDKVLTINMNKAADPAMQRQLDQMHDYIAQMAKTAGESADFIGQINTMMKDVIKAGQQAATWTDAMKRDVANTIEYFDRTAKLAQDTARNEHLRQVIANLKSEAAQKLLKTNQEWRDLIERDRKARLQAEDNDATRNKMDTVVKRVYNLLAGETDVKNIPEEYKGLARELIGMFNANDMTGRKLLQMNKKQRTRMNELLKAWNEQDGEFDISEFTGPDATDARRNVAWQIMDDLNVIREMMAEWNGQYKGKNRLDTLEQMGKTLTTMQEAVSEIYNIIKAGREMDIDGRRYQVEEMAIRFMADAERSGFKGEHGKAAAAIERAVKTGNITPEYFFKNLHNQALSKIWDEFKRSENRNGLLIKKTQEFMKGVADKYHYKNWDSKKTTRIETVNGPVNMTTEQMMALYATWKREHMPGPNQSEHLEKGGFYVEEGKQKMFGRSNQQLKAHRMDAAHMAAVTNALTDEQKAYVDEIVAYLSTEIGKWGNEATMRMYGIKKYKEKYYYPMKSWGGVLNERSDSGMTNANNENRAAHQSHTKRRMNKANNAIEIGNFTDVATNHIVNVINENTMAVAVENMNKMLNYKTEEGETWDTTTKRNMRTVFQQRYGQDAYKYLKMFLSDINGGVAQDPRGSVFDKLLSGFRKGAVAGSMSVAAQQPLSYIRAAMEINPIYLARALSPDTWRGSYKEMMAHSGVAVIKDMGRFDMGLGASAKEYIRPEAQTSVARKLAQKAGDWTTKLPEIMDRMTWTRMWSAVKAEQKHLHPEMDVKSDEFLDMVGERFNEVMRRTQVYDSVLVKSNNMRSKNIGAKLMTSFMAEPTVSLNVLMDAAQNIRQKGGIKKAAMAAATFLLSAVAQAAAKGIFAAGRNPDDDKTLKENFLYRMGANMLSEANPLGLIPGYSDLIEILSKGELSNDAMTPIGKLYGIGNTIIKAKPGELGWRFWEDTVGQVWQLFGRVPAKNIMRDVRAMINWFDEAGLPVDFVGGTHYADRPTSSAVLKYQFIDSAMGNDLVGLINGKLDEAGYKTSNEAYYDRIYEARAAGDMDKAGEMTEYLLLGKGVREETLNENIRKRARADESMNNMEKAEIVGEYGGNTNSIIKDAAEAGEISAAEAVDMLDLKDPSDYVKDQLRDGSIDAAEARKLLKQQNPDKDDDSIWWTVDRIEYKKETGNDAGTGTYYRLWDAMDKNKAEDIDTAIKNMVAHGVKEKNIKDTINKHYKEMFLAADANGKVKIRDAMQKAYKKLGLKPADADKVINKWK